MLHAQRYMPSALKISLFGTAGSAVNTTKKNEIQNVPYPVNATAPNVLPVRNSQSPAANWAIPPKVRAITATTGNAPAETRFALTRLSANVVVANPASPSGPGSAGVQPPARPALGSSAGATSASRGKRPASMSLLLLVV